MKHPEKVNLRKEKEGYGLPTAAGWGKQGVTANGYQGSFQDDGNILKLDSGDYCTAWQIYQKPMNCTLDFILYTLYLTQAVKNIHITHTYTEPPAEALGSYEMLNLHFGCPSFLTSDWKR